MENNKLFYFLQRKFRQYFEFWANLMSNVSKALSSLQIDANFKGLTRKRSNPKMPKATGSHFREKKFFREAFSEITEEMNIV